MADRIDPSSADLATARQRAIDAGLAGRARFQHSTFERTNLAAGAAGAVISIDAFQYAPRKRAAFAELAWIMRPGARAGIVCFEVDPGKVAGLPVLGVDPVADYRPLMAAVGLHLKISNCGGYRKGARLIQPGAGEEAAEEASLYCIRLNRVFAASTSFVLALGCRRVDPATAPALTGSYPGAKGACARCIPRAGE